MDKRPWLFLIGLCVLATPVAGEAVRVAPAVTHIVPDQQLLRSRCGASHAVAACTDFDNERLVCDCRQDGPQWRLTASASFEPAIYLADFNGENRGMPVRAHELMHIADVADRVQRYLVALESTSYDSEGECRRFADAVTEPRAFGSLMRRFRYQSNVKYLCVRPGHAP
jgi:hypothetical protein